MGLYVTGDTHGDVDDLINRIGRHGLSDNDILIIVGDFGFFWFNNEIDYKAGLLRALKPTILFLDGNHDNFDILDSFPTKEMFGGEVGYMSLTPNTFHLLRGESYLISNKRFIVMGGGLSLDKEMRLEREKDYPGMKFYWERELPTKQERDAFWNKYTSQGGIQPYDFILTHEGPEEVMRSLYDKVLVTQTYYDRKEDRQFRKFLQDVYDKHYFKKWFCGHHHCNVEIKEDFEVLYDKVVRLA